MLSKFENEDMIRETESDGRKRFYLITEKGKEMLMQEYRRLKPCCRMGKYGLKSKAMKRRRHHETKEETCMADCISV